MKRRVLVVAALIERGDEVLVARRKPVGERANLWEFPHDPLHAGETPEAAALRMLPHLTGVTADLGPELATLTHGVTRFRITLVCLEAAYVSGRLQSSYYQQCRWVRPAQLAGFPFSAPQRRLAQLLVTTSQPRLF